MTTLLEVLESAGYNFSTKEDCNWLINQQKQFDRIVEKAEDRIEEIEAEDEDY